MISAPEMEVYKVSGSLASNRFAQCLHPREDGQISPWRNLSLIPEVHTVSLFFGSKAESLRFW